MFMIIVYYNNLLTENSQNQNQNQMTVPFTIWDIVLKPLLLLNNLKMINRVCIRDRGTALSRFTCKRCIEKTDNYTTVKFIRKLLYCVSGNYRFSNHFHIINLRSTEFFLFYHVNFMHFAI